MGKLLKKKMQEIETQRYQEEFDNLGESIDKILIDIIDLERRKGNKTLTDENVINVRCMLFYYRKLRCLLKKFLASIDF